MGYGVRDEVVAWVAVASHGTSLSFRGDCNAWAA